MIDRRTIFAVATAAGVLATAPLVAQTTNAASADPLAAQPADAPPPAPVLPPPTWSPIAAQVLLDYINDVGAEGLEPADYDPAGLEAAMRGGNPMTISAAATDRFVRLADDLANGHVRG